MYELHKACQQGSLTLIKKLLHEGHNVEELDNHNNMPLIYAIQANKLEAVITIIKHQAKKATNNKRDYQAKRAVAYTAAGLLFLENQHEISANALFTYAANDLGDLSNKNDTEVRLYLFAKQKLIENATDTSRITLINILSDMINNYKSLRKRNEQDYQWYAHTASNLARCYRQEGRVLNAIKQYVRGISVISNANEFTNEFHATAITLFDGLAQCFSLSSPEQIFFKLAADCFKPNNDTVIALDNLLRKILTDITSNILTIELAIGLIDILSSLNSKSKLLNKSLIAYLSNDENYMSMKWIYNMLRSKYSELIIGNLNKVALAKANVFFKLGNCFEIGTLENKFLIFASDCLRNTPITSFDLLSIINELLHNKEAHETIYKPVIIFLDLVLAGSKRNTLKNQNLQFFLNFSENYQQVKKLRDLLQLKIIQTAYSNPTPTFFISKHLYSDGLADNLPPIDLTTTHKWTYQL